MTDVNEEQVAELVAAVLAGRQERIVETILATEPPEVRAAFGAVTARRSPRSGWRRSRWRRARRSRARILASVAGADGGAARKAVLVVLDMIKEHLTPGTPLEVPRARDIVPALQARLEAARAQACRSSTSSTSTTPSDEDLSGVEGWGAHAIRGSEGTEVWPGVAPHADDRVVKKSTYSAFTGSELGRVLDELKIDTIVLTGCLTEIGVLATATEALQRGFVVEVPPDAQAGSNELAERVALGVLAIMPPYGPARRARLEALGRRRGGGAARRFAATRLRLFTTQSSKRHEEQRRSARRDSPRAARRKDSRR